MYLPITDLRGVHFLKVIANNQCSISNQSSKEMGSGSYETEEKIISINR